MEKQIKGTHKLSKWLNIIIKAMFKFKSKYGIKNTKELLEKPENVVLEEEDTLVSSHVKNVFTIERTLKTARMVRVCLKQCFFSFNIKYTIPPVSAWDLLCCCRWLKCL